MRSVARATWQPEQLKERRLLRVGRPATEVAHFTWEGRLKRPSQFPAGDWSGRRNLATTA